MWKCVPLLGLEKLWQPTAHPNQDQIAGVGSRIVALTCHSEKFLNSADKKPQDYQFNCFLNHVMLQHPLLATPDLFLPAAPKSAAVEE